MANPIRLGIVGIGRAGFGMHCKELVGKEDMYQIVAACDLLEDRRAKMADKYDCATYEKIEDLIADPNVEMVAIATRSCDHFNHAVMALKAGKNVLLEKPMCETYEQAKQLVAMSNKPGMPRLYIRHNRRFEFHFEQIKELIANKKIGDIYEIHINRNSYGRRDDWQTISEFGGGQLLNWGPHIVDQSLRFIDGKIASMYSDLQHTVAAGDCEDHVNITFKGENGIVVKMQISGGVALPCPEYVVYGTKGAMEVVDHKMHFRYLDPTITLPDPVADPGTPGQTFGASGTFAGKERIRWIEEVVDDMKFEEDLTKIWDYMYEDFRNGVTYPISMEEAIAVIEVIDKVKSNSPFAREVKI